MNIRKKNPKKGFIFFETNVAYHTQTYANVHIRPPNWMYANIRNYDLEYVCMCGALKKSQPKGGPKVNQDRSKESRSKVGWSQGGKSKVGTRPHNPNLSSYRRLRLNLSRGRGWMDPLARNPIESSN